MHFQNACRSAGLRLTQQRIEIFDTLAAASDHPSPEVLYRRLIRRMPTVSRDTVYRTLATLARHQLVQKVETFQSQGRFEVMRAPHHHLICRECQAICDFAWDSFESVPLPEAIGAWGVIEKRSAVLSGLCSKCRKRAGRKRQRKIRG